LCSRILLQINLFLIIGIYTGSQLAEESGEYDDDPLALGVASGIAPGIPSLEIARTWNVCFGTLLTSNF
jgi:hypothetical protein